MSFFQLGEFKSHSGIILPWKVECSKLTPEDLDCLARIISDNVGIFHGAHGVVRGGVLLASALQKYKTIHPGHYSSPSESVGGTILLVDDVLTTGASMEEARESWRRLYPKPKWNITGAVIFARGPCPDWVRAVWQFGL